MILEPLDRFHNILLLKHFVSQLILATVLVQVCFVVSGLLLLLRSLNLIKAVQFDQWLMRLLRFRRNFFELGYFATSLVNFLHQVVENMRFIKLFRLFYLAYVTILLQFLRIILIDDPLEVSFFVQVHLDYEALVVFDHHGVKILLNKLG